MPPYPHRTDEAEARPSSTRVCPTDWLILIELQIAEASLSGRKNAVLACTASFMTVVQLLVEMEKQSFIAERNNLEVRYFYNLVLF